MGAINEPEEEEPETGEIESPPEGSYCSEHPQRLALAVCPRCGAFTCLSCWHGTFRRCHACIMREPEAVATPVPWEDRDRGALGRLFGTFFEAFSPAKTSPSFAYGEARSAISFWLLSFLPFGLLKGIVPYTHKLLFGPYFQVRTVGQVSTEELALDIAQAAGLGLLMSVAIFFAAALPYASLTKAYSFKGHPAAPWRTLFYRGWLIPFGGVLFALAVWGSPADPGEGLQTIVYVVSLIPLVVLLSGLRTSARVASGVGPFAALAVIFIPLILMIFAEHALGSALAPLMPDLEALRSQGGP